MENARRRRTVAASLRTGTLQALRRADRAATAAETQPDADEIRRREAELAQREQELRVQQDELRRERERLDAGRGGGPATGPATTDGQGSIDADQATAPSAGSSVTRKEPTSPIVVPPGTEMSVAVCDSLYFRSVAVSPICFTPVKWMPSGAETSVGLFAGSAGSMLGSSTGFVPSGTRM